MKLTFIKTLASKTKMVHMYTVSGTIQELERYKEHMGNMYTENNGVPVYYTTTSSKYTSIGLRNGKRGIFIWAT